MTYLLDTNIIRELMLNNSQVVDQAEDARAEGHELVCAPVTRGELRFGVERLPQGMRRRRLEQALSVLLSELDAVVADDEETADVYGATKANLERRGRPIPDNDLWLASLALSLGGVLVTNDGHFSAIEGLSPVNWLK